MLYHHEQAIRERHLEGEAKLACRTEHSEPLVSTFWRWCEAQCLRGDLLPSNPLSKALHYARERQTPLKVFPVRPRSADRHQSPRASIAKHPDGTAQLALLLDQSGRQTGRIIQSLIVTFRLHGIDVYTYLVDVLQRVGIHPAKEVIDLNHTPRMWKTKFSQNPINPISPLPINNGAA